MTRPALLYVCFDAVPAPKGASTHVAAFTQALAMRYDVTLISLGQDETLPGVRHLALPATRENYLDRALALRDFVWDALETNTYDFVQFRTMWAATPVAEEKARQGFRVVCEVNGVESIELPYHYPALRAHPPLLEKLRTQERLAFTTADAIVTPSAVTQRYLLRRQAPAEKITVIPNGVDCARFTPTPRADGPLTLLYLGTLAPWQGVEFLLDALRRAVRVQPLRLRIIGSGTHAWRKAVIRRIDKYDLGALVDLLPPAPHDEVPAIINTADICVAPLLPTERNLAQGCCPVKIFEYLACGKPVVAADLPVTREILTHDVDALLYKVTKPARLAECLLRLAGDADLRARLGAAVRQRALEFDWRRAQEALLKVYDGLAVNAW